MRVFVASDKQFIQTKKRVDCEVNNDVTCLSLEQIENCLEGLSGL